MTEPTPHLPLLLAARFIFYHSGAGKAAIYR